MKTTKLAVCALAFASLVAVGCGGGDDTTGGGGAGGTGGGTDDMSMPVFRVQSGTYSVSMLTKVSDACMKNLDDPSNPFSTLAVTNDGHGTLSLGSTNVSYLPDPALYSQGTGMFTDSYHATTTLDAQADASGCMYHLVRNNNVVVTADNTLQIDFTETQSSHTGTCTVVAVDCTSHWTFDLSMAVH